MQEYFAIVIAGGKEAAERILEKKETEDLTCEIEFMLQ